MPKSTSKSSRDRADYYAARRAEAPWRQLLAHARARAQRRGLDFDLTDAWARERWLGVCELSGVPFVLPTAESPGANAQSPSLDRVDRSKGFTKSNVRFVLAALAAMRNYASDSDMVRVAVQLAAQAGLATPIEPTTDTGQATASARTITSSTSKEIAR